MLLLSVFPGIGIYLLLLLFVFPFIALLTCNSQCYVSNSLNVVTQLLKTRLTEILKATVLIIIVNFLVSLNFVPQNHIYQWVLLRGLVQIESTIMSDLKIISANCQGLRDKLKKKRCV